MAEPDRVLVHHRINTNDACLSGCLTRPLFVVGAHFIEYPLRLFFAHPFHDMYATMIAAKRMMTNRNPTRAHLLILGFIAFSIQRKHSDKTNTTMKMNKGDICHLFVSAFTWPTVFTARPQQGQSEQDSHTYCFWFCEFCCSPYRRTGCVPLT